MRWRLLRLFGAQIPGAAIINAGVIIRSPRLTVGNRVFINSGVILDNGAGLTIGDDVAIAPGARIITSRHQMDSPNRRAGAVSGAPVTVGNGSWIGAGATVLPGVHIADGCVIAAGAVVTKDTEPHGLYAGVPARRVKDLPQ